MSDTEQRHILRDSLFVMAGLRLHGTQREMRVKIRNLSAGGLMAEGDVRVSPGDRVAIDIRNLGWVNGAVAWVQDNRFGVAFTQEVDAKAVRGQTSGAGDTPAYVPRRPLPSASQTVVHGSGTLRKV